LLTELEGRGSASEFVRSLLQSWPPLPEFGKSLAPPHPPTFAANASRAEHDDYRSEPLTHREQEVLALLAQRLTAEEVAQRLVITENTVKRHRTNIYQKLGVGRLRDALAIAKTAGMLDA